MENHLRLTDEGLHIGPWSLIEKCKEQSKKGEFGLTLSPYHTYSLSLFLGGSYLLKLKGVHCCGWSAERMWGSVSLGNMFFMEIHLGGFAFMAVGIDMYMKHMY